MPTQSVLAVASARIMDVVRAEITEHANKRELYIIALDAYHQAHPEIDRSKVATRCLEEINTQYYKEWGERLGVPEDECVIAPSWFLTVASQAGYTQKRYARWDGELDNMPELRTVNTPNTSGGRREPVPKPINGDVLDALDDLRAMLLVMRQQVKDHDVRKLVGDGVVDTFITEANAQSTGLRELVGGRHAVPANLQVMFAMLISLIPTNDKLFRRIGAELTSTRMDGDPMTSKAMFNILRGRTADVPECVEPKSLVMAVWRGYHGARCPNPECHSRRCIPAVASRSADALRCLHCSTEFTAPEWAPCPGCHRPLGDHDGLHCPHCETPLHMSVGAARRETIAP